MCNWDNGFSLSKYNLKNSIAVYSSSDHFKRSPELNVKPLSANFIAFFLTKKGIRGIRVGGAFRITACWLSGHNDIDVEQ